MNNIEMAQYLVKTAFIGNAMKAGSKLIKPIKPIKRFKPMKATGGIKPIKKVKTFKPSNFKPKYGGYGMSKTSEQVDPLPAQPIKNPVEILLPSRLGITPEMFRDNITKGRIKSERWGTTKTAEVYKNLPPVRPHDQASQMIQQENETKMMGMSPVEYRRSLSKGNSGIAQAHRDTPNVNEN